MNVSCTRKAGRQRAAFTLVELLVVIAIIGVLVALLLPAVQRVRESARRATCSNNGRQCGLAIHNFLSTHGRFPQCQLDPVIRQEGVESSWIVAILPYLEEVDRYDLWMSTGNASTSLDKGPITSIECPSSGWAAAALGRSSYPVVSNWGSVWGAEAHSSAIYTSDGILDKEAVVGRDTVADGLSNTAMLGEIATHDKATMQFVVANNRNTGTSTRKECLDLPAFRDSFGHGLRPFNPAYVRVNMAWIPKSRACGSIGSAKEHSQIGVGTCVASWHPGGSNLVMGDGAVKFASDDVDCGEIGGDPWAVKYWSTSTGMTGTNPRGVWGAIATRAGGESAKLP